MLKSEDAPEISSSIRDFFQDKAQFLVMDFIEGEDLATRLKKRLRQHQGPFTCQELLPLADKVLAALEYLHSRPEPIIHRDIKPSNIKLADDGEIYLLDFGLAKGAAGQMSTIIEGQTSSSVPGFTREYAPLEQLQDTGTEPQSDIYACGATLYHLMTGQLPISATQRDEALQRGKDDPLRPAHELNPAIPVGVSNVISHALAVRWWDRTGSAKEMREELKRACAEMAAIQPGSETQSLAPAVSLDAQDGASTLPLLQLHTASPPGSVGPMPLFAKTLTRLRRLRRRPWLIAALALVLLSSLALTMRLAFPGWFARAVSTKPDAQAAQPSQNLKPPQATTPTDLKPGPPLKGHTGIVWSVAFSPDGGLAASASEDKTIILWDTKTWAPKFLPLTGHTGAVYSIAFSPDGRTLASGSHDTTIRLWDTRKGQLMETLSQEHTKPVLRLTFSPDGNFLASCSGEQNNGDKEIRLWDANNCWKSKNLRGHEDAVIAVAFSPDSSKLVSAGYDNSLRLWDTGGDRQSKVLRVYDQPLKALAFSLDGKYLACGSSDKTIKLWLYQPEIHSWVEQEPLAEHRDAITTIAFSPDHKTLVSASKDNTIRLWDVAARTSKLLSASQGGIRALQWSAAFSPDGQTLLTGGEDKTVNVWR